MIISKIKYMVCGTLMLSFSLYAGESTLSRCLGRVENCTQRAVYVFCHASSVVTSSAAIAYGHQAYHESYNEYRSPEDTMTTIRAFCSYAILFAGLAGMSVYAVRRSEARHK